MASVQLWRSPLLPESMAVALENQLTELLTAKLRNSRKKRRITPGSLSRSIFCLREPPLGHYVPVRCTFVDRSSKKQLIYVRLIADAPVFDQIVETMNNVPSNNDRLSNRRKELIVDDLCEGETLVAAPYGNSTRYRGRVMRIHANNEVDVFFVDIGHTERLPLKVLEPLTTIKALKVAQLAIPCKLQSDLASKISTIEVNQRLDVIFDDVQPTGDSEFRDVDASADSVAGVERLNIVKRNNCYQITNIHVSSVF